MRRPTRSLLVTLLLGLIVPDHVWVGESAAGWAETCRRLDPGKYGVVEGSILRCDDDTAILKLAKQGDTWQLCRVPNGVINRLLEAASAAYSKSFADTRITYVVSEKHFRKKRTHISEFAGPSYTWVPLEVVEARADRVRKHPLQKTLALEVGCS